MIHWMDSLAHFLYAPTTHGQRATRARWHHRIHLIPGWLLAWICDRYERALGVHEKEGEPVESNIKMVGDGDGGVGCAQPTRTYACRHVAVSGPLTGPAECWCGCVLVAVETR